MVGRAWFILVAGLLVFASRAGAQTHVRLRAWAAAPGEQGVLTLADVAEISGDDALRLGAIVVKRSVTGGCTLELAEVRSAMDSAGTVNWGLVTLSGARCTVRAGGQPATARAPSRPTSPPALLSSTGTPPGTLRAAVMRRLEELFASEPGSLRAALTAGKGVEIDLDAAVADTDQVHVEAGASGLSGRVPVRVEVYREGRLCSGSPVIAEVEVRRVVARVSRVIERGEAIATDALTAEDVWTSPGSAQGATVESALGSVAKRRLTPGSVLLASDVQAPIVVNRGDEVWVHVLSGELRMKVKARALGSARDNEIVKLQVDGAKKTFEARMSGRGVAVKVVGDAGAWGGGGPDAPAESPQDVVAPRPSSTARPAPVGAGGGHAYMDLHRDNVSPGLRARREKEAAK